MCVTGLCVLLHVSVWQTAADFPFLSLLIATSSDASRGKTFLVKADSFNLHNTPTPTPSKKHEVHQLNL